ATQRLRDQLIDAAPAHERRLIGTRALEPLRLEKSHRALYRDIDVEHTALESGLDRFVKLQKGDFTGRDALLRQRQQGVARRLVTVEVAPGEGDLVRNEGVYRDGRLVGRISSGTHSYHFGHNLGLAYLAAEHAGPGTALEIPILGQRRAATVIP